MQADFARSCLSLMLFCCDRHVAFFSLFRDDDGGAYGTSYTNRKTKEYDLLNDIVKQTRKSVATISQRKAVRVRKARNATVQALLLSLLTVCVCPSPCVG